MAVGGAPRRIGYAMLRFSGLPFLIRETVQRRTVTIVLLHDPAPDTFARQLRALSRRYAIVPLRSYLACRAGEGGRRLPPKSLILTFDDGHRGNVALLPALLEAQAPATIFLCSGIVGTHRRFWFQHGLPEDRVQALKLLPDDARLRELDRHGYRDDAEFAERQAISREELDRLREHVDLQAHTITHPILIRCSPAKAEREIAQSKRQLEALGLTITTLSYPNGDYAERELEALERAGFVCGITVDGGYNTRRTDLRRLRRISVDDEASPTEVIVKASGLVDLVKRARHGLTLAGAGARVGRTAAANGGVAA